MPISGMPRLILLRNEAATTSCSGLDLIISEYFRKFSAIRTDFFENGPTQGDAFHDGSKDHAA